MKDESPGMRRRALLAASAASAIGVGFASAEDQKSDGDETRKPTPLRLKVTLTDGQVVTLSAAEVVIDFGNSGQLVLKPETAPMSGRSEESQGGSPPKQRNGNPSETSGM